jgi:hypothetical protein
MSGLQIHAGMVALLLDEVRRYGARSMETGAFLLSHADAADELELVALPGQSGVRRRANLFEISGEAIGRLFEWASESERSIRAQIHSHKRTAFLSRTDLKFGFNVEGFVTCVIPHYADPPKAPAGWGWWEYRHGSWQPRKAPVVVAGAAEAIEFDAEGLNGR